MEGRACLLALDWASHQPINAIAIHTDSANLVHYLKSRQTPDIDVRFTVADIKALAARFDWCQVIKVSRAGVQMAHERAKQCKEQNRNLCNLLLCILFVM